MTSSRIRPLFPYISDLFARVLGETATHKTVLAYFETAWHRNSTYTSYESHTSPEASLRLYQILKPLSVEKRLDKKSGEGRREGKAAYEAWPKTNHEAAQITGKIRLKPGQRLTVISEHGATGIIRIHREGETGEM